MKKGLLLLGLLMVYTGLLSQVKPGPDRIEGDGPFRQLVIRGVTIIDGTGSPPIGPMDIEIRGDRITRIQSAGYPGLLNKDEDRIPIDRQGQVLEATGQYLLPGFIDMHAHIGGAAQGTPAEYVYKLWMGHGITTVRDVMARNGLTWTLTEKDRSEKNEIVAPRIQAYMGFGLKWEGGWAGFPKSEEDARAWVRENKQRGADGIKYRWGVSPQIMAATLDEAGKVGLRTASHHDQMGVAQWNVLHSARAGLTSMEHWYGLPEALFTSQSLQNYSLDFNYNNEQDRFGEAGMLWLQAAKPGSNRWNTVRDELIDLDFTMVPTFSIYEANRDLHRARRAEWHEEYTLPSLWSFYQPSFISHGSYWHDWTTELEVAWKKNYQIWMKFINDYKNHGGRVAAGSDSGFIFQLYGFSYIRELELLREAGFHPLEVIRAATLAGAEAMGMADEIGTVQVGKKADLVLVKENPLKNLKVLYGTGAIYLSDDNEIQRTEGIIKTIKDGIVYDSRSLLNRVRKMVTESKEVEGFEIQQPGQQKE